MRLSRSVVPALVAFVLPACGGGGAPGFRPSAPIGIPFSTGVKIALGNPGVGPITLHTARFKVGSDGDELQVEFEGECARGHDQKVTVAAELFDRTGQSLGTLQGSGQIEEHDSGTVKAKRKMPLATLGSVAYFRVKFWSARD